MVLVKKIGVVGGGAWGTALANLMASQGHDTLIWAREEECARSINTLHMNMPFLPDMPLDARLHATTQLSDIEGSDLVLMVTPAQFMRASLRDLAPYTTAGQPVILCSKGIELNTMSLMTEVLHDEIPHVFPAVLSGPSFAKDVVDGLPTAVTLACEDPDKAAMLADIIGAPTFRPYTGHDLIGAEVGGAIKNVLAIACGITLGLGLGKSAHAAIIARGFAEMTRLAVAMGAELVTLTGLCGLGDLVLTCSSLESRNMSCGFALGQGQSLNEIMASRTAVTEGVASAPALVSLSKKHDVDMPICTTVAAIVAGDISLQDAVKNLLQRPYKTELAT